MEKIKNLQNVRNIHMLALRIKKRKNFCNWNIAINLTYHVKWLETGELYTFLASLYMILLSCLISKSLEHAYLFHPKNKKWHLKKKFWNYIAIFGADFTAKISINITWIFPLIAILSTSMGCVRKSTRRGRVALKWPIRTKRSQDLLSW